MSYILDALRRAEAERQRGSVPGLNTPGASPLPSAPLAAPGRDPQRVWLGVLALAGLAALGAGGWLAWRGANAPEPAPAPAQAPRQALQAPPAAVALPAPAPPAAAVPPVPAPVVVVMPAPVAAPAPAPATVAAATVPVPPAPQAAAVPAAVPPTGLAQAQRVPTLAELPEPLRRQVPPLVLGGSMHSEQAAQRLVIVNGQVAHEGDEAAPGVRVLQIRPKAVVFGVGGQRFELPL